LTDASLQDRFDHIELARRMIAGGAEVIQYRDKAATTRAMIATARAIGGLCARGGATLIVNDRVDVALAADAGGVHLGQDDFPVALARRLLGPDRIIGASADDPDEAEEAWRDGADYVGFGPIFSTGTKSDTGPVVGIDGLAPMIQKSAKPFPVPVIAIGGLDETHVGPVLRAGAHGVAILSAICCAADPEAATRGIAEAIRRATAVTAP
jgi:thiamine-phosphate pyrophosphorylase